MRRIAILAAAVGGLAVTSSSFAALTLTANRAPSGISGFDRVNLVVRENSAATTSLGALSIDVMTDAPTLPAVGATGTLSFQVPGIGSPVVLPSLAQQLNDAPAYGSIRTFGGFSGDLGATSVVTPAPASNKPAYQAGLARVSVQSFFAGSPFTAPTADFGTGLIVGSAVVPTGTAVRFVGDLSPTLNSADKVPFNILNGGAVVVPPAFSAGTLGGSDARQSLATTGDNPTIYTLTIDFGNLASVPANFSVDTNMTNSGTIASVGSLPSGITASAAGDVISGTVSGGLRGSFDIALTGSGSPGDTAILRIVAIPEPATLSVLAGVGLLALRRRK